MSVRTRRLRRFWLAAFLGVLGGTAIGLSVAFVMAEPDCGEQLYECACDIEEVHEELVECVPDNNRSA